VSPRTSIIKVSCFQSIRPDLHGTDEADNAEAGYHPKPKAGDNPTTSSSTQADRSVHP